MRGIASIVTAALTASIALPARAQEAPIRASLAWTRGPGAEECIDDLGVRAAVESRLERAVFVPPQQSELLLTARVEPGQASRGWRVTITAASRSGTVLGERDIVADGGECNALVDSIAIVMALAVESSRRRIRIHVPAPRARPVVAPWRADLGPEVSAMWGVVPGMGLAGGLRATLVPPGAIPFDLVWSGYAPRRQQTAEAGADYVGWQAAALACPRVSESETVTVSLCAGAQFGLLRATGVGISSPRTATSRMGWLLGRADFMWTSWRIRPRIGVTALFPAVRDRFVYDEAGVTHELYQPSPVGLSADFGLSVRVP